MKLNLQNIEITIFYNKEVHKLLPEMSDIFKKWIFGLSHNKKICKMACVEFLNRINQDQIKKIETFLKTPIEVERFKYQLVKNHNCKINSIDLDLNKYQICLYRKGDNLSITGLLNLQR